MQWRSSLIHLLNFESSNSPLKNEPANKAPPRRFPSVAVTMAEAANRVFVKPEASDDYLIERAREPSKKVQTYQFMKGKYHPGNRLDPGMER